MKRISTNRHLEIQHQSRAATADLLRILKQQDVTVQHYYDSMWCTSSHTEHVTKGMNRRVGELEESGFVQATRAPFSHNDHRILRRPAEHGQPVCSVMITTKFTPIHAGYEITNGGKMFHAQTAIQKSGLFKTLAVHPDYTRFVDNDESILSEFELVQHNDDGSYFMLIDWWASDPLFPEDVAVS